MPDDGPAIVHGVEALDAEHGPLFAVIGVFDGLHRGHQYLLTRLVEEARARAARSAVITFDSHPDEVIVGAAPPLLLDPTERTRLLGDAGVEVVVVEHFDAALRATEYDAFIRGIALRTPLAGILMTPDAAFGHDRRGTPEAVAAMGDREGFELVVTPPFTLHGRPVRSSDIRTAIAAGDVRLAEELLGRPYSVVGAADATGRLSFEMPVALPPSGTYPVRVDGQAAELRLDSTGSATLPAAPTSPGPVRLEFVDAIETEGDS